MFSKKGLMDRKQRKKMEFWKGRKNEKQERKQKRKKRSIAKQAIWGNKVDKKPLKLQENSLLGPFYKTQAQKHRQQKTKPPKSKKNIPPKNLFAFWQTTPIFGKFLFFFKLHSFMSTKLCFAENTIKIVFSAEHSFCVSQIVKPLFEGKPKKALLQPKVPFWVFPRACWNPYFCSVWLLWMGTKKGPFSQNR